MGAIFLGKPSQKIKNFIISTYQLWPSYTTLTFVDGTTETKEITGVATWENIGVKRGQNKSNSTLKSCKLGNKVTEISSYAFNSCLSLTSINIPSSFISLGNNAFQGCNSLTSMTVDPNNPKYDSRDNCNAIIETSSNTLIHGCRNTTIPNSVTSIGEYAFEGYYSLPSINIPSSVSSIGDYAFARCYALSLETIPNSVTSIGYGAFHMCYSLMSVNIPNSVSSIRSDTFWYCSSLTSINIPSSVTSIGAGAFQGCSSLTSIVFDGKTITQITSMSNYPWGLETKLSAIVPGIS